MRHLTITVLPLFLLFFSCSGGSDIESSSLTPDVPSGLEVSSVTRNSAVVKWKAAANADNYEWKLERNGDVFLTGKRSALYVNIEGLEASCSYSFSVRALNGSSFSKWSDSIDIITEDAPEIVPDAPDALCIDSPLLLKLGFKPEFGTIGFIKVFDSADNLVDAIDLSDIATVTIRDDGQMIPREKLTGTTPLSSFMDVVKCGSRWRIIHYTPLRAKDDALEIRLHNSVLDYGKEYYVTMDAGVVKGHPGISKGEWSFKTKSKPELSSVLNVNSDGSADFCTVQGALCAANSVAKDNAVQINVAAGTYLETLCMRDKNNVTLSGADRDKTIIAYANSEGYEGGSGASVSGRPSLGQPIDPADGKNTGGRGVMLFENCDNLRMENLTMHNTFGSKDGQAEVLYFNSGNNSHHLIIKNCTLRSLQDTFLCKGIVHVDNSLIAGHCDYIWGYPEECIFKNCEIRSEAAGYIVQARTRADATGFVFINCTLTGGSETPVGSVYLARATDHEKEAEGKKTYDNVTYINCSMSSVIRPVGWLESPKSNPENATATAGWKEYGSTDLSGKALNLGGRSKMARVLTADEAAHYLDK